MKSEVQIRIQQEETSWQEYEKRKNDIRIEQENESWKIHRKNELMEETEIFNLSNRQIYDYYKSLENPELVNHKQSKNQARRRKKYFKYRRKNHSYNRSFKMRHQIKHVSRVYMTNTCMKEGKTEINFTTIYIYY